MEEKFIGLEGISRLIYSGLSSLSSPHAKWLGFFWTLVQDVVEWQTEMNRGKNRVELAVVGLTLSVVWRLRA